MEKKKSLSLLACLSLTGGAWFFASSRPGMGAAAPATVSADAPPTVAVARASRQDLSRGMVLTGEFLPFQEVELMAKVAGYVKNINVDIGDRVRQGQLLAVLEVPEMADDLAKAQASLQRHTADVARARDELRRAQSAHEMAHLSYTRLAAVLESKPGLVAQQEIDDAHSRDLVAEAQVSAEESALAAAQEQVKESQAELGHVKTLYNYTMVTAPFSGVITKRYADTGSMIQAGTASQTQAMPLVRLSENTLLRLILPVPESVVSKIRNGEQVEVRVPSLGRAFAGKVARFADKVQTDTRTMSTEVDVPNPQLLLVPGMFAEVDLRLDQRKAALAVPVTAVTSSGGRQTVYAVDADGRIQEHPVSTGLQTATEIEIQSGLQPGDLVVTGNRSELRPGERVKPKLTEMIAAKGD
jgi:RND family efflux transporter MFP subunit